MKKNVYEELNSWLEEIKKAELPIYDDLPDVSLYMDQIVSFIAEKIEPYTRDELNTITSFMVNNYVKAKIIDAPKLKRYSKNQVAYLIALVLIKPVTSMANISVILDKAEFRGEDHFVEGEQYDHFVELYREQCLLCYDKMIDSIAKLQRGEKIGTKSKKKIKQAIDPTLTEDEVMRRNLHDLSLRLLVEAEVNKMMGEKILSMLEEGEYLEHKEKLAQPKKRRVSTSHYVPKSE